MLCSTLYFYVCCLQCRHNNVHFAIKICSNYNVIHDHIPVCAQSGNCFQNSFIATIYSTFRSLPPSAIDALSVSLCPVWPVRRNSFAPSSPSSASSHCISSTVGYCTTLSLLVLVRISFAKLLNETTTTHMDIQMFNCIVYLWLCRGRQNVLLCCSRCLRK